MGATKRRYAELDGIYTELEQATRLHRRLGCPVLDVSELSVEDTAMRIVRIVGERRRKAAAS
jgi:regulator of PEP synthase PpsR (kinase-PPPase family)